MCFYYSDSYDLLNGEVVTELGTKIKCSDVVKFHDEPVSIERKVYVLLNKPKDTDVYKRQVQVLNTPLLPMFCCVSFRSNPFFISFSICLDIRCV